MLEHTQAWTLMIKFLALTLERKVQNVPYILSDLEGGGSRYTRYTQVCHFGGWVSEHFALGKGH